MTDIKSDDLFSRQFGIIHPDDLKRNVLIIGAGGIGSWTALALAKTGVKEITVVDFDIIEAANFAPQFYNKNHNNKNKAEVLAQRIAEESSGLTNARFLPLTWEEAMEEEVLTDIDSVIMAVDSMDVRKQIWTDVKFAGLDVVIDGRMSREMLEIHALDMTKEEVKANYEKNHLFASSEVDHIPCTERAVAYNQFVIAGLITSTFKKFVKHELDYKRILFDLTTMTLLVN